MGKRAVLLVHGFLSDENDFAVIIDSLYKHYQNVLSVRLPGHGEDMGVTDFNQEDTIKVVINAFDMLRESYDNSEE